MERPDHIESLEDWLALIDAPLLYDDDKRAIREALYTFSELGLLEDLSIDYDLAMKIWSIVERARTYGFPEELRV